MSYSQMFHVGWSSSSAPSMNGSRIEKTSFAPSYDGSTSRTSPSPPRDFAAVTLRSVADGEARSRT